MRMCGSWISSAAAGPVFDGAEAIAVAAWADNSQRTAVKVDGKQFTAAEGGYFTQEVVPGTVVPGNGFDNTGEGIVFGGNERQKSIPVNSTVWRLKMKVAGGIIILEVKVDNPVFKAGEARHDTFAGDMEMARIEADAEGGRIKMGDNLEQFGTGVTELTGEHIFEGEGNAGMFSGGDQAFQAGKEGIAA